jgi:hypothetical protein
MSTKDALNTSTGLSAATGLAPFLGVPAAAKRAQPAKPAEGDDEDEEQDEGASAAAADDDGDAESDGDDSEMSGKKGNKRKVKKADAEDGDPDEDGDDDEDEDEDPDEDEDKRNRDEMSAAVASSRDPAKRLRAVHRATAAIVARTRASARKAEQARVGAILKHPSAEANLKLASRLAFKTRLSAKQACALLDETPSGGGLARRMADYAGVRPAASGPGAPSGQRGIDASWDAAAEAAGIKRK